MSVAAQFGQHFLLLALDISIDIYIYMIFVAVGGREREGGWFSSLPSCAILTQKRKCTLKMHIQRANNNYSNNWSGRRSGERSRGSKRAAVDQQENRQSFRAASVTTSQVTLAKALKYAEISLGSCAWTRAPPQPAGQSAVILGNAPVSLTTPLWPKMKAGKGRAKRKNANCFWALSVIGLRQQQG